MHPILAKDARNILVILPSWVGDACMATPVLRHLAQHRPDARIVVFGRANLQPLIDGLPWVNSFHAGAMRGAKAIGEVRRVRAEVLTLFFCFQILFEALPSHDCLALHTAQAQIVMDAGGCSVTALRKRNHFKAQRLHTHHLQVGGRDLR